MSESFTKLFSSITNSSVWMEDSDTRIVWVTLLAMADADGYIGASIPGIAHVARVPLEVAERAMEKFQQPDKYSRSKAHDGRRIEEAERGWVLLNHAAMRLERRREDRRESNREAQARRREKLDQQNASKKANGDAGSQHASARVSTRQQEYAKSAQADADADADAEKETPDPPIPHRAGDLVGGGDFENAPRIGAFADNDQVSFATKVLTRFRNLHLATFGVDPTMSGKHVHAFPGQLAATARAQGVRPGELLDRTFKLWASRPRDKVAMRCPYAAFCARFGELVGEVVVGADSSGEDRLVEAITAARMSERFEDAEKLETEWARQYGRKRHEDA